MKTARIALLLVGMTLMACHDARRSNPLDPDALQGVVVSVSQDVARREAIVEWTPYSGFSPFENYLVLRSGTRLAETIGDTLFSTPDILVVPSRTWKVDTLAVVSDRHQTSFVDTLLVANISYVYRVSVLTVGGLEVPSHDSAPVRGPSMQQIAFYSDRAGNWELFVMNADGSGIINLTDHPRADGPGARPGTGVITEVDTPTWSPDGERIAFVSSRDFNHEIYIMNADGSDQINVTNHPSEDFQPSWSPDGSQLVFSSMRDDGDWELYKMDSDGTNVIRLTENTGFDFSGVWSPDGTRIVFESFRNGKRVGDIFVMNTDGTDITQLTNTNNWDYGADWSPDGTRIAFRGSGGIHLADADGSNPQQINTGGFNPDWSPDGTMLVYDCRDDTEICVSNADGTNEINITNHPASDEFPTWRPVVK